MMIAIHGDRIITSLYEKAMNLYLYIPPHSDRLLGVLTRLVSGNILCIYFLCSKQEDINLCMKEFYVRLLFRGYQRELLIPEFTGFITRACAFIKCGCVQRCAADQDRDTRGRVLFCLKYHPKDLTSKYLQNKWRQHLLHLPWEPPLWRMKNKHKIPIGINSMCVAYSHPKHLGNIFTYQKVDYPEGDPVSSYME